MVRLQLARKDILQYNFCHRRGFPDGSYFCYGIVNIILNWCVGTINKRLNKISSKQSETALQKENRELKSENTTARFIVILILFSLVAFFFNKDYFIGTILFQDDGVRNGFEQIQFL